MPDKLPWNVTYDLMRNPASWDFMNWLINAEIDRQAGGGQMRVRFRPGPKSGFRDDGSPRSLESKVAILNRVMRPALRLLGAVEHIGPFKSQDQQQAVASYRAVYAVRACLAGHKMPKWYVPDQIMAEMTGFLRGRHPVVITLREATHWPTRNSNIKAWLGFAKSCGEDIIFVRDTEKADEPLEGLETNPRASRDVLWRAALMSSAKCNLLVTNGPSTLALHGHSPWLQFILLTPELELRDYAPKSPEQWRKMMGIEPGQQFPWSSPKQRVIWEKDTPEAIERAWASWKEGQ